MGNINKFEDFLDRMKGLLDKAKKQGHIIVRVEDLENAFPELRESENERIRKTLIEYIKGIKSWNYFLGISKEQMIAWLEKQVSIDENEVAKCVLNEVANSIMRWLDANLAEGNMCLSNMECEDIENAVRNANWQKIYGYMKKKLEKQDNFSAKWEKNIANNKPALNHSVLMKNIYGIAEGEWNGKEWIQYRWSSKIKDSDVLYWMNLYELEKQGKHTQGNTALEAVRKEKVDNQNCVKPTNKIKPKFHEGDWVISNKNNNNVYQVERIDNNRYYLRHYLGGTLSVCFDSELIRLWTIQDAKDGDVLSDGTAIFIFKDLLSDGSVMSYCDYDTDSGESDDFCPLSVNLMCLKITPATKEQRDKLEKAMADAGYRWNPDEKKMEKIEQKSQRMASAEAKEAL